MPKSRNDLGAKAVQVLATTFVLFGGAGASIFMILTNSNAPTNTLLIFGGGCATAGLLLWLLREPDPLSPRASIFSGWFRKKPQPIFYEPRVRRNSMRPDSPPPQPPTAESIREIAQDGMNTWVPSSAKSRSKDRH